MGSLRNAFNTETWSRIVEKLKSSYIINVIEDYFRNREIVINRNQGMEVTGGVPQGSVLGPLLWNILYETIVNLKLTKGATSVAFADDLALVSEAD
ncbi:hypothetical protein Zmor_005440 [Zophobas morio]|uniref:Reverse transcriptase domain-containing protein n=1 Tax=Zophobas morio TaxID=2755281 RepID=A0AA38INA9_9CUCU|nr:hypothetical protein Zmor_005440 [Zophobas morio]